MPSPDSPDPLTRALADWRVTPRSDPNFRPAVWERIRARSRETWSVYVRSHLAGWAVALALGVGAAGWAGHAAGLARLDAARDRMVVSYLVDLDPRVQARLRP